MNSIVDACLKSINDINENEFIAEMNAFDALLENYNKMLCLMEYDTSRVFIEAEVAQNPPAQNTQPAQADNTQQQTATTKTDNGEKKSAWEFNPRPDKKDGSGKENIIISILAFIPRLIAACVKFIVNSIKNLFSGKDKTEQAMNNVTKQLDAAPDAFRKWALNNEDNLAKLMEEASGQTNWAMHFRISPIKFDNSTKVATGEKGFLGINKYEIRVYPPISTDTIENNLKAYTTEVLDPLIKQINSMFVHKTNDADGQRILQLNSDLVKTLKNEITVYHEKLKKQNEIAAAVKKTQDSTKKLIVQIPGSQLTTMDYSKTPKDLYTKLGELSQIAQVMGKRTDTIEKLLQEYQKNPGTMTPDSPETLTAFKEAIEDLKGATSDTILQIRFISDLATNLPKELEVTAQGIPKIIQKWVQSNGGNAEETAETTEGETKTEEQTGKSGEVNNDAAAEGNSDGVPQEAWDALNKQNRKAAITGAVKNAGNTIKSGLQNLGGKIKTLVTKDPNRIHHVWVKDPTGKDPKFGTQDGVTVEMPEKSLPNFINSNKQKGFVVTALDYDTSFIGIDEDGNRHEITMEEFNELSADVEIITEQDYLMYYQFENISSLEF